MKSLFDNPNLPYQLPSSFLLFLSIDHHVAFKPNTLLCLIYTRYYSRVMFIIKSMSVCDEYINLV